MPVKKKENSDISSFPSYKKIIDYYIYSTGLNAEDFSSALEKKIKVLVNKEEVLNIFLSFIESSFSKQSLFKVLDENNNVIDLLFMIYENSRFLSEILIREPNLLFWVLDKNIMESSKSTTDYYDELSKSISVYSSREKIVNSVKRYYRRQILRIGIRDMFLNSGIEIVTGELSGLADAIIRVMTGIVYQDLKLKYGKIPKTDFTVFGLGKLGGEELNYSSDIDIIFVYKNDGEFKTPDKRTIHFFDFYQESGRNIIKILTETTSEGYLYRVDTRLRPEGKSGPVAPSYSYLLSYYESRGEIWERQMLIKARVIYDENNFGEEILKYLSSFIYPRYPLKNPLDEIAKIKLRIESGNDKSNNIKLCKGGIRDIEFSVQALQLLNGGKVKAVREKNTLMAIEQLRLCGLLTQKEEKTLKNAYLFYRNIEHRLQIKKYQQTFIIPEDSTELLRLSRSLGFKNKLQFQKKLNLFLNEVRRIFQRIFRIDVKETYADIEQILSDDDQNIEKILSAYGLQAVPAVKLIRFIVYGTNNISEKKYPVSLSEIAKEVLALVFNNLNGFPDKNQLLKNLEYIISRRADIEAFLRQLLNEKYLKIILNICGYSNSYTKILSEREKLLELIYNFGLNELPSDILALLSPEELRNISFIQWISGSLDGKITKNKFYYKISDFIDKLLINIAGGIHLSGKEKIKIAVFALGKLGSMEMGVNSDADLFFVYDDGPEKELKLSIGFFEKFVRELNSKTGSFLEIDLRLRPEGKNAPIAISRSAFIDYLGLRASFWERLALTRIRPVFGDSLLIEEVINETRSFVYKKLTKNDLIEALKMRKSIEQKAIKLDKDSIDIKTMEGGLVDIEFIVQVAKIVFRDKYPSIEKKNTPDALSLLKNKKIFPLNENKYLADAYYFYRLIENYIALNNLSERYILRKKDERNIYKLLDFSSPEELFIITAEKMKKVRVIYQHIFKKFERLI
jgi:[glutamine synthetase] adenylyltransferase / [glutamine synthetase]-adenylyl-L-tyrosine phosphorylase